MTLFKRVFNSHTAAARTSQPIAMTADDDEVDDLFADMSEKSEAEYDQAEIAEQEEPEASKEINDVEASPVEEDPFAEELPDIAPETPADAEQDVITLSDISSAGRIVSVPKPVSKFERRPLTTYDVKSMPRDERDGNADLQIQKVCEIMERDERGNEEGSDRLKEIQTSEEHADPDARPSVTRVLGRNGLAKSATSRPARNARRVKTRMLGFDPGATDVAEDPFRATPDRQPKVQRTYPVGWIVVTDGPGTGHGFALYNGVSTIGRGEDQAVSLDFGDTSISREKHAAIAYDDENNAFFLGHGGKSNIVRLNNRPVLSTEDLNHGDTVRIGETTLRFVGLCGPDFSWGKPSDAET